MGKIRVVGPRIEVAEAKALLEAGEAVVLDVVASRVWPSMTRTIPGSIRIPPEEVEKQFSHLPGD